MTPTKTRTLALLLSASLAACAGQAEVRYAGNASNPELVEMAGDPSVMVVANSEEPVFYSENTYWLYRDRQWYRSTSYRGGWSRVDQPVEHVRRIHQPTAFVHYRNDAGSRTTFNQRQPAAPPRTPERPDRATPAPREARDPADRPLPAERVAPTPERPAITPEQQQAQHRDRLEPTREAQDHAAPQASANPRVPPPPRPAPAKEPGAIDGNDRPPLLAPTPLPTPADKAVPLSGRSAADAASLSDVADVQALDGERSPLQGPAPRRDQRPEAAPRERPIAPPDAEPKTRQFDSY